MTGTLNVVEVSEVEQIVTHETGKRFRLVKSGAVGIYDMGTPIDDDPLAVADDFEGAAELIEGLVTATASCGDEDDEGEEWDDDEEEDDDEDEEDDEDDEWDDDSDTLDDDEDDDEEDAEDDE